MKFKKIMAAVLAAAMVLSLGLTAFAVSREISQVEPSPSEASSEENSTVESSSAEHTSSEHSTNEHVSEEESKKDENPSEEETKAPTKADVIALIAKLLGQIDFEEVKDTLNDINEALGLPRVETFADIPAYADAIYEKLEEMGLGYGDIINGITSSDLLAWLNNLIFGGGSTEVPETTTIEQEDAELDGENGGAESTPDTGIALGASLAAAATLGLGGATAFVLRKRND